MLTFSSPKSRNTSGYPLSLATVWSGHFVVALMMWKHVRTCVWLATPLDRQSDTVTQRQTKTETDRDSDRDRCKDRHRGRHTDKDRHRHRHRDRQRLKQTETVIETDAKTDTEEDTPTKTDTDRHRDRHRDRQKHRHRHKHKHRQTQTEPEWEGPPTSHPVLLLLHEVSELGLFRVPLSLALLLRVIRDPCTHETINFTFNLKTYTVKTYSTCKVRETPVNIKYQ